MTSFAAPPVNPPTRTFGGSVDMEVLNDRLWPVFVRGALRGAHHARSDPVATMKKREFLRLLEGCAPPEQLTVVYHAEAGRTAKRTFPFSAFKRALCVVAARLQPELRPARALAALVDAKCGGWPKRDKRDIEPARDACASVLKAFAPCLAKVFAYYGQTPTDFEIKVLQRHAPRADVDRMQQSLPFSGWATFCSTFNITDRLGSDAVGQLFVDSSSVTNADTLGGLELEEFFDAVLRASLLVSVSPGGGAVKIPGAAAAKSAAEADRIALKADSAPQRCLAGFRVMRAKLERTVPRQANAGHGTSRHYSGEAHFAGGRQHGSSNYHLLLEGAKEFQSLADACWRDLQKHAATLLADAPRAKPASRAEELDDLLEDLAVTRPVPPSPSRRGGGVRTPQASPRAVTASLLR